MTANPNDPMIVFSDLLARGWKPSLVDAFLNEPDLTKPPRRYPSAGPMRFYRLARVEAIEATEAFLEARGPAFKRSKAGRKGANRIPQDLVAEIERLKIQVRVLPLKEVQKRALRAYQRRSWFPSLHMLESAPATDTSEEAFLQRIMVNFVRHSMTKYDDVLHSLVRRLATEAARIAAKRKLYSAIATAYPELEKECDRQFECWMADAAEREFNSGRRVRSNR